MEFGARVGFESQHPRHLRSYIRVKNNMAELLLVLDYLESGMASKEALEKGRRSLKLLTDDAVIQLVSEACEVSAEELRGVLELVGEILEGRVEPTEERCRRLRDRLMDILSCLMKRCELERKWGRRRQPP